jgi:hypothetical protein
MSVMRADFLRLETAVRSPPLRGTAMGPYPHMPIGMPPMFEMNQAKTVAKGNSKRTKNV